MKDSIYIGVIGTAKCHGEVEELSRELGRGIAELGAVLICGGRGGVMEAAAKGAKDAGGTVIGILPGEDPRGGNPYLSFAIATGLGDARNAVIARTSDILVAVSGGYGTLSEIGLALKMGKPVIGLFTWRCQTTAGKKAAVYEAAGVEDALQICRQLLEAKSD